jgi:alanine dehydrogenase
LNLINGRVTYRGVAEAHGIEYTDPQEALGEGISGSGAFSV